MLYLAFECDLARIPAETRAIGRNIHVYAANDPTTLLGGLVLNNEITDANLYPMVEIIVNLTGRKAAHVFPLALDRYAQTL